MSALATRLLLLICGGMTFVSTQNFKVNMLNDLNKKLDKGGSNAVLVAEICNFMRDKYHWLEHFCLVYDDVHGSDKHWFSGYWVASLHRNGKCGIVFYRTKGVTPMWSSAYNEVDELVNGVSCPPVDGWFFTYGAHAKDCFNKISAKIKEAGIEWTGLIVISDTSPFLYFKDGFSTHVAYVDKIEQRWGYNTLARLTTARIILLMK